MALWHVAQKGFTALRVAAVAAAPSGLVGATPASTPGKALLHLVWRNGAKRPVYHVVVVSHGPYDDVIVEDFHEYR